MKLFGRKKQKAIEGLTQDQVLVLASNYSQLARLQTGTKPETSGCVGCQYRGDDCIDMSGKGTDWCTLFPKQNQMMKYRKKPVVVEAMRYDKVMSIEHFGRLCDWLPKGTMFGQEKDGSHYIRIHTLEGDMKATPGDWIIKGVQGEFYPCKPDIFNATYELACFSPEADNPYPLCVGNDSGECEDCVFWANYEMEDAL